MLLGVSSSILVTTIEIGWIGQLGTTALAAIAFTFPVTMALMSVMSGISIGCSSVIARRVGGAQHDDARRLGNHGILLALLFSGAFAIVAWLFSAQLFATMGAAADARAMTLAYMRVYLPGVLLFALTMVTGSVLRAHGEARVPGLVITGGAFVNLVLDPILIFGLFGMPRLELEGAAWAITLSRGVTAAVLLAVFWRRALFAWAPGFVTSVREIFAVGIPAMATQLIGPVSAGIITALLAAHGDAVVAGFGVAGRIESVAVIVLFALSGSIGPFLGQNFGAGLVSRVVRGVRAACIFCLAWGVVAVVLLLMLRGTLIPLFDSNPAVFEAAMAYLAIVPLSYGLWGVLMMTSAAFNSLGQPLRSTVLSFVRMFVVYVPLALLGNHLFGYEGVFLATALANAVMGIAGYLWLRHWLRGQADEPPST